MNARAHMSELEKGTEMTHGEATAIRETAGVVMAPFLVIGCLFQGCGPAPPGFRSSGDGGSTTPASVLLSTVVDGEGSVDPESGTFDGGSEITLTTTPAEGWRFDHWEGDLTAGRFDHWRDSGQARANPSTLVLDADKTVTAVFARRQTERLTVDLGNGVVLRVIEVPGGTFTMGSSESEQAAFGGSDIDLSDESPQRVVTVSTFAMGETEVTQAQYRAVMGTVPTVPDDCVQDCFNAELDDEHPAAWVTWEDATAFCDALSAITRRLCRLPTEAEWEYACRAGSTTAFTFGDSESDGLDDHGWYSGNSGWPTQDNNTHDVGGKLPNAFGLFDMHGNAWEWVGDWFGTHSSDAQVDPSGPATKDIIGPRKVLRGGAFSRYPWALRSAYRLDSNGIDTTEFNFGFRIVCE